MPQYTKLEKGIIYTTGVLFLDVIAGQAFTGRPLHETLGINFHEYTQKAEDLLLAAGWVYTLINGHMRSRNEAPRKE